MRASCSARTIRDSFMLVNVLDLLELEYGIVAYCKYLFLFYVA